MKGKQDDEAPLREFEQWPVGETEEPIKRAIVRKRFAQRPEMDRNEKRQCEPGNPVYDERPICGVRFGAVVVLSHHRITPKTARIPRIASASVTTAQVACAERPRQLSHSSAMRR